MLLITTNLDAFGVDTSLRDVGFQNKYMIDTNGQNFEVTLQQILQCYLTHLAQTIKCYSLTWMQFTRKRM